jgi:hypothetical protein
MQGLLLLVLASTAVPNPHVKVSATYVAPVKGAEASIAVQLTPVDSQVRVNEDPAPRLKLEAGQQVLQDKPVTRKPARPDPGTTRYLDPDVPVVFPVTVGAGAGRGAHTVRGTVTYFYCSKAEGWCRKGTAEIAVPVHIP